MPTNMLECPMCAQSSDIFVVYGTLVTGEMSVRVGPNGTVLSAGPIRPKAVIKPGNELKGRFLLTCPHCEHSGKPDTFVPVMTSILSGKSTRFSIEIIGMCIPVTEDEQQAAHILFTASAVTSWDDTGRIATMLGLV